MGIFKIGLINGGENKESKDYFFCRNRLRFNDQCSHHTETSQLIYPSNQLTGFYTVGTLVVKELMMNIRNLGSKESVGVNYKDGICVKLCLKLWFERDWYFCIIKSR